jgi:hypothetical protein
MLKHDTRKTRQSKPLTLLLHVYPILIISFMLLNISCSRQITEPVDDSTPGRRDYVWTVDTIQIPFNLLQRMWGSSPTDVWAVGPGGGLDQTIWHFDGTKWKTDGVSRNIAPWSVFGFASNDVWICGEEGKIWHFDGSNWQQSGQFQPNDISAIIEDIWGTTPSDIYATGFTMINNNRLAIIMHYDGKSWGNCSIPKFNYELNRVKGIRVGSEKQVAILGFTLSSLTGLFIFDGGNSLVKIYEAADGISTWAFCQSINNELYYVKGNIISTYSNSSFHLFLQVNDSEFGCQIFGRNRKDIFIRMFDGIAHYNGTDIQYLYKFIGNISILDAAIFDNEIFFLAYDKNNDDNLIYHGKLQ